MDSSVNRHLARPRLILASASPARRRILQAAGIDAEILPSGVDESAVSGGGPESLCLTLARLKAHAVAERLPRGGAGTGHAVLVLGCDSVLAFDGESLGKPSSATEATARWRRMRGGHGVLYTGHTLLDAGSGRSVEAVAGATVRFGQITDAEISAYVATGEPLGVAGAFTIDGLGGPFIERIDGDPGTVIGLSLPLLRRLLADLGVPITSLWRQPPG